MNEIQDKVRQLRLKAEIATRDALLSPKGSDALRTALDIVDDCYDKIDELTLLPEYWEGTKLAYKERP